MYKILYKKNLNIILFKVIFINSCINYYYLLHCNRSLGSNILATRNFNINIYIFSYILLYIYIYINIKIKNKQFITNDVAIIVIQQ